MWGMMLLGILLLASVALAKDNHTILIDLGNYTYINEAEGPNNWTVRSHIRYLSDEAMRPVVRHKRNLQVPKKNDNIPPVVNPDYDDPVPKFNGIIVLTRGGEERVICSAVLIELDSVLTTASCLKGDKLPLDAEDIFMRMTTYHHDHNAMETVDIRGRDLLRNPNHDKDPTEDIAVILLQSEMPVDDFMEPAKLPKEVGLVHPTLKEYWDLSNMRASHYPMDYRSAFWHVKTSFIQIDICREVLSKTVKKFRSDRGTCASYFHEGDPSCDVDQGSALSYEEVLIGFLARKEYCGSPRSAGLFINLGIHKKFVCSTIESLRKRHSGGKWKKPNNC